MGEERTGQPDADRSATERPTVHVRRRLTVSEAAEELGISAEAVRSRIKRGTLRSTKENGTVYVLLTSARTRPGDDQITADRDQASDQAPPEHDRAGDQAALVESLLEQVAYMREQLAEEREARRRADTIMAQLSQANAEQARTIRSLEAPRDEPQAPESAAEGTERVRLHRRTPEALRRPQSGGPGGVGGSEGNKRGGRDESKEVPEAGHRLGSVRRSAAPRRLRWWWWWRWRGYRGRRRLLAYSLSSLLGNSPNAGGLR